MCHDKENTTSSRLESCVHAKRKNLKLFKRWGFKENYFPWNIYSRQKNRYSDNWKRVALREEWGHVPRRRVDDEQVIHEGWVIIHPCTCLPGPSPTWEACSQGGSLQVAVDAAYRSWASLQLHSLSAKHTGEQVSVVQWLLWNIKLGILRSSWRPLVYHCIIHLCHHCVLLSRGSHSLCWATETVLLKLFSFWI